MAKPKGLACRCLEAHPDRLSTDAHVEHGQARTNLRAGPGGSLVSGAAIIIRTIGAWDRANAIIPGIGAKMERAARDTLNAEAIRFRDQVRTGLLSGAPGGQAFAPLSPLTKAISGAGKGILNRSSLMVSTIVVFRRGNGVAVGVRGAREKIADIHEGGRTFRRKLTEIGRAHV